MTMLTKDSVTNPMTYFSTVGEEIEEIISSNNISMEHTLKELGWEDIDLKTKKKITKDQASKIENLVKINGTAKYLLNFQQQYKSKESEVNSTYKNHLKIFNKVKHLVHFLRNEFIDGMDLLEDISNFLEIEDEEKIFEQVNHNIALYRLSGFEADSLNLYSWLKRGEHDFKSKDLPEYDMKSFLTWIDSFEWKQNLRNTNYIFDLPNILEKFGVALIYTPYLDKTVFGAVRWFNERPLIQISDRGKCMATFWYTLFHEFGHVIIHENDEIFEGNLNLSKSKITKKEQQANAFAFQYLFNGDMLRKYIFTHNKEFVTDNFINEVSNQFKVDKMFTAFWMKKALIKSKTINQNIPTLHF